MLEQEPKVGAGSQSLDTDKIQDKPLSSHAHWSRRLELGFAKDQRDSKSLVSEQELPVVVPPAANPLSSQSLTTPALSPAAPTALPAPVTLPAKKIFLRKAAKTSNSFSPLGNSPLGAKHCPAQAATCPGNFLLVWARAKEHSKD